MRIWGARIASADRVPMIRHLALCVAALAAYLARIELQVGNSVLWIVGCAAVLNLQPVLLAGKPRLASLAARLSPLFGVAGWLALATMTGGARSPFVAGLWLEIVLAASATSVAGVLLVTILGSAGLWAQQVRLGLGGSSLALLFETAFLLLIGALVASAVRRAEQRGRREALRVDELRQRLARLEQDLEGARTLGRLGENVAQLGHGLKNAVHSLRGFTDLIERGSLADSERHLAIHDGLRESIRRLEEISRSTLRPGAPAGPSRRPTGTKDAADIVGEAVRDVGVCFPGIRWSLAAGTTPSAAAPAVALREALTIVLQNAAEAMKGSGDIDVELRAGRTGLEIRVRDQGPGITDEMRQRLFRPGHTTKEQGHGLGLFLARRLLEPHGGALTLETCPGDAGGSLFSIKLPLSRPRLEA